MKFVCLIVCLVFGLQTELSSRTFGRDSAHDLIEIRKGKFDLINPLLDCYEFGHSTLGAFIDLEKKIQDEIHRLKVEKKVEGISVYYRELDNGGWIGINEEERYSPASLLKLPILIAALKQSESQPDFLSQKLVGVASNENYTQSLGTNGFRLEYGKEYTIEELLSIMIIFSNNDAKEMVLNAMDKNFINNVFYDLGIDIFSYRNFEYCLSVKQYASYYRILYNSTYLNKEHSNLALQILSRIRFKLGLNAGVPENIMVAHKFGERDADQNQLKQLHDCGIVYREDRPYLICVMAKGKDFEVMEEAIASISRLTYNYIPVHKLSRGKK